MLADYVVDQVFGGMRQHQPQTRPITISRKPMARILAARAHHLPDIRPQFAKPLGGALFGEPFADAMCLNYCMGCCRACPNSECHVSDAHTFIQRTSGFAYPSWKPDFYPEKLPAKKFLAYYATRLNAVEVNYTFRRLPSASTLENWVNDTRAGFVFPLKAHMRITHILRLQAVRVHRGILSRPSIRCGPRGGWVRCCFNLAPALKCDEALLADFLATLPRDIRCAFEFRHASWLTDSVYGLLEKHGVALCLAESEKLVIPKVITANFVYSRLRMPEYSAEDRKEIAERCSNCSNRAAMYTCSSSTRRPPQARCMPKSCCVRSRRTLEANRTRLQASRIGYRSMFQSLRPGRTVGA